MFDFVETDHLSLSPPHSFMAIRFDSIHPLISFVMLWFCFAWRRATASASHSSIKKKKLRHNFLSQKRKETIDALRSLPTPKKSSSVDALAHKTRRDIDALHFCPLQEKKHLLTFHIMRYFSPGASPQSPPPRPHLLKMLNA